MSTQRDNSTAEEPIPEVLLLDLGGVTFPSPIGPLLAAAESIRDPGLPKRMVSSKVWKEVECGFITIPEFCEQFAKGKAEVREALEGWFEELAGMEPSPRMIILLTELRIKYPTLKIGAVTNNFKHPTPKMPMRDLKGNLLFDTIVESAVEGFAKGEQGGERLFKTALERLDYHGPTSSVLYLDDLKPNLTQPASLGIRTKHVITPEQAAEAIRIAFHLPSYVIPPLSTPPSRLSLDVSQGSPLQQYLASLGVLPHNIPDQARPFAWQFSVGQSNPTYLVGMIPEEPLKGGYTLQRILEEKCAVLRKQPPGKLLPSAHDVSREYTVMSELGKESSVPVPQMVDLCTDKNVCGADFYVMKYVCGVVFTDPNLPKLEKWQRRKVYEDLIKTAAAIHTFDWRASSALTQRFRGDPSKYVRKQVQRWSSQGVNVDEFKELAEKLNENTQISQESPEFQTLVHGDFRLDNCIFDPHSFEVVAVLDWELSTCGNSLVDVASALSQYSSLYPGDAQLQPDFEKLGIPTKKEVLNLYARIRGIDAIPEDLMRYMEAFQCLRMAGILYGVMVRSKKGNASQSRQGGSQAPNLLSLVKQLCSRGLEILTTSNEPKAGEITVECEDDPSTGEGSCSSSRRRSSLLASLWPIAEEEEEPLTSVHPRRVKVSPRPPLRKPGGDIVVFEDCCFSDSVSRLSSFTSEDAAFFSQLQEPIGIEDLGVEMPFGHLPPVDAEELAEFDIALASEVFESIQVLCEEYERFFQARKRLEWLDAYLQRHMDREHAAMDFRTSVQEDLCIVRLRQKLEWLDIALQISKTDDTSQVCANGECVWLHEQLSGDKNLWLRQNKDGTMTLKIEAVLRNPTYHIISLVREVDLHANWIPFLAGSRRDHIIQGCGRRCQQMVTHEYSVPIPFVPSRSVSLYAFACDALDEPDLESIIIYGRSVPDGATDFWGYPVPKLKGSKMDLKTLSFVMKPLERGNATSFTMIANVDPKVYLPEKILAWLCKQYAKYIFHSIEKLSRDFDNTEYPKRIAENREFYGFVEASVLRRIQAMDNSRNTNDGLAR